MQRKLEWLKGYLNHWGNGLAAALIVSTISTFTIIMLDSMIRTMPPNQIGGYAFMAPIRFKIMPFLFLLSFLLSFIPTIFIVQLSKAKIWLNVYVFLAIVISFFSFVLFGVGRNFGFI